MTEKLYEKDGTLYDFDATVLACEKTEHGYAVTLDRTAFFPGGGGQACDVGRLGGVPVTGASLSDGDVLHHTAAPLAVGATVRGEVDRSVRFPGCNATPQSISFRDSFTRATASTTSVFTSDRTR